MSSQGSIPGFDLQGNSEEEQTSSTERQARNSWEEPTAARGTALADAEAAPAGEWQAFREVKWRVGTATADDYDDSWYLRNRLHL